MKLIRQGDGQAHVRGRLRSRSLCGELFKPDTLRTVDALDVRVKDVCIKCLAKHMRRKVDTR